MIKTGENLISAPTPYGYSRSHRAAEMASIAAVFLLLAGFALQSYRTIVTPGGAVNLILTGLCAYLASDLVSGMVHWAGDTIGDERVPFLGPNFIKPFRVHHTDQLAITRHDFVETNGNNCILMLGPLGVAYLVMPDRESFGFFTSTFVAFMSLFAVATNQFHKWAHQATSPRVARWLQSAGLILSTRHHAIHHAAPHDRHYCITVGWLNPLLNAVRFFRAAEWFIARVRPHWLHIDERKRVLAEMAASAAAISDSTVAGNKPSAIG
jgi:hypothetical protein